MGIGDKCRKYNILKDVRVMDRVRINQVYIHCRGRGAGKTTFYLGNEEKGVRGLIPEYHKSHPRKSIVIFDTFDSPDYRKYPIADSPRMIKELKGQIFRISDSDTEKFWKILDLHIDNSLVILEDSTKYVGSNLTKDQIKIVVDSKQKDNDIFFTFHSLALVAPGLVRISNDLILGKTKEEYTSEIRKKFPLPGLKEGFERIKKSKNPYVYERFNIQ